MSAKISTSKVENFQISTLNGKSFAKFSVRNVKYIIFLNTQQCLFITLLVYYTKNTSIFFRRPSGGVFCSFTIHSMMVNDFIARRRRKLLFFKIVFTKCDILFQYFLIYAFQNILFQCFWGKTKNNNYIFLIFCELREILAITGGKQ